jgi:hypothetical protein
MEAVSTRGLAFTRSEPAVCALVAAASAAIVAWVGPPGGDAAAHLYRTELVREGVLVWDNLWFAGHYPLASYSVLYYLFAALVGNELLVVAGAIVSAALFAALARNEWGEAARWPARAYAVLAATPLFTGTYSYALGIAAALGALRLLQLGRRRAAVAAAALALGFAPLAFAFLCLALAAAAIDRRKLDLPVAAALSVVAALELAVLFVFPSSGRYPFSPLSLAAALTVSALGAALAFRRAPALAWFFALWAAVALVAFAIPSPFGDNLTRLRMLVFPLVLVAAAVARFRPRALAAAALAVALVYNLGPDLSALPKRLGDVRTAEARFWQPALDVVGNDPNHRVEVVPSFGHWEAYWVPRAGIALARGWYRQIDLVENPELYGEPLRPEAYRRWLDRLGVRFVLLPNARLGPMGASREADLLRSGRAGLEEVFRGTDWTVYAVPDPTPILAGGRLTRLTHSELAGGVEAAGAHLLRVRWSPYWEAAGDVCVEPGPDGLTILKARRAGSFSLRAAFPGNARCPGR